MACQIIDGNRIAKIIREEIKSRVAKFRNDTGIQPTLVALHAGADPASQIYIDKKIKACEEVGICSYKIGIKPTQEDILWNISRLNRDNNVHGYILQLPLPDNIDPRPYFRSFDVGKDVDVFHPENVGLLVQGTPRFRPCTPHGIQQMLYRSGIQVASKKVVIINRSNVVGKPLSSMLIQECDDYANATVTVCHDRTPPELLKSITKTADIVVVAVGKPGFLTADMISEGSVVVDVGITRVGDKVVGDVDFEGVSKIAGAISKVPGGVGPMTVSMLLYNTLEAAKMWRYGWDATLQKP